MTTELAVYEQSSPPTLFGTDNATAIIASATDKATALADVIKKRNLYSNIEGKEYVRVEGWTLLGTLMGVFPSCVWTRKLEDGWEARVEARTLNDKLVGAAEAMCTRDEPNWKSRKDYALRSMAQTRATAKALRLPLGFIMALAGYEPTPAEEMERESVQAPPRPTPPQRPEPALRERLSDGPVLDQAGNLLEPDDLPFDEERGGGPAVESGMLCRFCNGAVFDNTRDKRTPTSPDYRCKDKSCNAAAWVQQDGSLKWSKR